MNNEQVTNADDTKKIIKRNRFFGILIIFMVVAPMGMAYIMYQTGWGVSSNTTNKGLLLNPPLPIQELTLSQNDTLLTALFSDTQASKKWRLLVPVTSRCADICQKNLYTTRQVHIRLAEKAYRVERIILSLDELPVTLNEQLDKEHPNTLRPQMSSTNFSQWVAPANIEGAVEDYYYLVDQEGYMMMRYDVSHTGQDLLDDIKKLLKFTYDK
jgi:cytochrome oxidase Cu insertion factor (SCO1/SenC/PrrC family)